MPSPHLTHRRVGVAAVAATLATATLATMAGNAVVSPSVAFAQAAGIACDDVPVRVSSDGRIFPHPLETTSYIGFEEFACGMDALAADHPDLLSTRILGQTDEGNDVHVVVMTDATVPGDKPNLLISSSIHGNEVGAREGAVRQIEEMVRPDLLGGEDWVAEVLATHEIHWLFPNPDGWLAGEGGTYSRGNSHGTDLNRNYPVAGFIAGNPLSEVESQQVADYLVEQGNWSFGTDNHGQLPDTYAAAGLQIVGQFDYQKSEDLAHYADDIEAKMAEYNVLGALALLRETTGLDLGPYHWGTLYDILGYSASGSMIDWFNTPGLLDGSGFATELTLSHANNVNQTTYQGALNQVWVDSIRAINRAMFDAAVNPVERVFEVGGEVAYVFDPRRITDDDANGRGYDGARAGAYDEVPYDVSRMQFFSDLNRYADRPLSAIRVPDVLAGDVSLDAFDTVVLNEDAMPEGWVRLDAAGDPVEAGPDAAVPADEQWFVLLRDWVERGGNLVVTDAALATALPRLGIVDEASVTSQLEYVGAVDEFIDRDQPLNAGLRGVASQTFDTVPIGYAFDSPDSAPNWMVDAAAWEAAGGVVAGIDDDGGVVYGEVAVGDGVVRILGALLPNPTEEFFHPFGLLNYAVTYTGYTLLQNMLVWDNPARTAEPAPDVADTSDQAGPDPAPDPAPLPATGGGRGAAALGLALAATAVALATRRR